MKLIIIDMSVDLGGNMSYSATVYRIFIASPSDVNKERKLARDIILEWNDIYSSSTGIVLLPVCWETHSAPEMGNHPQKIINKTILKDCDILIGIFWHKVGTKTDSHLSGTIEEIDEHIKSGKLTMIYFSKKDLPHDIDIEQLAKLREFKANSIPQNGLYYDYVDENDFKEKLRKHIEIHIARKIGHHDTQSKSKPKESDILAQIEDDKELAGKIASYKPLVAKNLLAKIINENRSTFVWDALIDKLVSNCNLFRHAMLGLAENGHCDHYAFQNGYPALADNNQAEYFNFLKRLHKIAPDTFSKIYNERLLYNKIYQERMDTWLANHK